MKFHSYEQQTHKHCDHLMSLILQSGLVLLGSFCLLHHVSSQRFIAADEGFYLLAGKLVAAGHLPYLDFFYPQMPILPFLHAVWISLLGADWETARLIATLFATATATLLFSYLRGFRGTSIATLALVTFATAPEILSWFTVCKTYVFAAFPLIVSCLLLHHSLCQEHTEGEYRRKLFFLLHFISGLLLGIAIGIRLFYIFFIPVYFLYVLIKGEQTYRKTAFSAQLLGLALAATPHLFFMIRDFDTYWFNNIGYHLNRNHRPEDIAETLRFETIALATGIHLKEHFASLLLPLLLWSNIGIVFFSAVQRRMPPIATALGLILFISYLIPTPIHLQYFATCIPFFILGISTAPIRRWIATMLLLASSIVCVYTLPQTIERLTISGEDLKGIDRNNRSTFVLSSVVSVSEILDSHFPKESIVISQWPGYLFQTQLLPISGLENQFWIRIEKKLTPDEAQRYKLMTRDAMKLLPTDKRYAGIIIEDHKLSRYFSPSMLRELPFERQEAPSGVTILKRVPE